MNKKYKSGYSKEESNLYSTARRAIGLAYKAVSALPRDSHARHHLKSLVELDKRIVNSESIDIAACYISAVIQSPAKKLSI